MELGLVGLHSSSAATRRAGRNLEGKAKQDQLGFGAPGFVRS